MSTWIRMRDPGTGHHFDAAEPRVEALKARGAEVVEGYPVHTGANARAPKPHQPIEAARRRRRQATQPAAQPEESKGSES